MITSTRTQDNTVCTMTAKWTSLKMDISQVKKWSKAIACLCLVSLLPAHAVNAATYLFHNDHLGTPQALTDSDQQVVWQSEQDPFGEVEEVVNVVEQNLRFAGQYFDVETGLHYNYFRDYDSSIGRYITSDPIGLFGGLNTFGYVMQNPLKNYDPNGLKTCGSGWNEPIVPDNPLGYEFSSCCENHDNCYGTCRSGQKNCDDNFYQCMLAKCKGKGALCKWAAKRYYNTVRKHGKAAYQAAQEDACQQCLAE